MTTSTLPTVDSKTVAKNYLEILRVVTELLASAELMAMHLDEEKSDDAFQAKSVLRNLTNELFLFRVEAMNWATDLFQSDLSKTIDIALLLHTMSQSSDQ